MKKEFRLAIATILLLLPNAGRAQWLTQSFELKDGWNAIYLHVDASHTDIVKALGYDLSTIDQSPVEQVWAWMPKSNSIQFIQSPQAPVNNTSRWSEWQKDKLTSSELQKIRGNHGYLVYVNLPSGQTSHKLEVKGKPVLPRYEWTTTGLNFIGFSVPSNSPPNFDQYLVHSPELHRNGEIYLYNGGPLTDGTNPARLFSHRSTEVRRGEAMWIRGVAGQFSNYFGPIKVTLQNEGGVHFGNDLNQYRLIVRNMTSNLITIKLAPVASEQPPAGEPRHIGTPPLVVRGELSNETLVHNYDELTSAGSSWTLESKDQPGSGVEIVLGLDRAKMSRVSGDRYAGLLRITDSLTDNNQSGVRASRSMTSIYVQVSASVPSLNGLWVGEASVEEVRHDLTEYSDSSDEEGGEGVTPDHISALSSAHLAEKRSLSIAGWSRIRKLPDSNSVYGIVGELDNETGAGGYFAVNSDGKLLFGASQKSITTANHIPLRLNQWNHVGVTYTGDYKKKSVGISIAKQSFDILSISKIRGSSPDRYNIISNGLDGPQIINNSPGIKAVRFTTTTPHDFQTGDLVKLGGIKGRFESEFPDNSIFPVSLLVPSSPGQAPSNTKFVVHGFANETPEGNAIVADNVHASINLDKIEADGAGTRMITSLADSQMVHFDFKKGDEIQIFGGVDNNNFTWVTSHVGKIYTIESVKPVRPSGPGNEGGNGLITRYVFQIKPNLPSYPLTIYDNSGRNLYFKRVPSRLVRTTAKHKFETGDQVKINSNGAYNNDFKVVKKTDYEFIISGSNLSSEASLFSSAVQPVVGNAHSSDVGYAEVAFNVATSTVQVGDKVIISGGGGNVSVPYYSGFHKVISVANSGTKFTYEIDPSAPPPVGIFKLEKHSTYTTEIQEINSLTKEGEGLAKVYILGSNIFYKGDIIKFTGGGSASKYNNKTFEVYDSSSNRSSDNEGQPQTGSGGNSYIQIILPAELKGQAGADTDGAYIEKVGEIKFYINGNVVDSFRSNNPSNQLPYSTSKGGNTTFLKRTGEGEDEMPSDIRELKIYGDLLTEQEILADYNRDSSATKNSGVKLSLEAGPVDNFYQGYADPSGLFPVSRNSTFGKVRRPYKLRFLFHRDSEGTVRLLQRIYNGRDKDGNSILSNSESALDPNRLSFATRMSSVHLPFSHQNAPWVCEGDLGLAGIINVTIMLSYDDHASSPFLHTYHPDHDNLDPHFSRQKIGYESWNLIRGMRFTFEDRNVDQNAASGMFGTLDWGSGIIGGEYRELITVQGKEITHIVNNKQLKRNEMRQYEVRGTFGLKRISDINDLTIK